MHGFTCYLGLVVGTALVPAVCNAQAPAEGARPGELRLTTERVVVFKDGHALLVKTARGTATDAGRVFTDHVPDAAVLGSFWASCESAPIRAMRAEWVEETAERTSESPCSTMRDLLVGNQGRTVRLTLQWPEERQVTAKVLEVLETTTPLVPERVGASPPTPWSNSLARWAETPAGPTAGTQTTVVAPVGGAYVVLEPVDGEAGKLRTIVPVADIRSVTGDDLRTTCARTERVKTTTKRLTFELGAAAAAREVAIRILYFTPGMRWIPTYRLSGDLEERGQLMLQAELLNELEDIDGAAVDLVVGVPNFRFKTVVSPLSLERTLRDVLQQAAPQLMGQSQLSNALFTQRSSEWRPSGQPEPGAAGAEMASELAFTGEQDMFVYTIESLALPRGARATVPVWSNELRLRHLYTLDIEVARESGQGQGYRSADGRGSPLELARHDVWHQLELENPGPMPWTTGAALIMKGTLPLGQDLLTYTPPRGATRLPITVAVDVRGDYDERQLSMEPNAMRWNGNQYARIVKRGTARITNYKAEAVDARVHVALGGRILTADGEPQLVLQDFRAADWQDNRHDLRPNGHSEATWSFRLEPGATRELGFEFEVFLR